MPTLIYSPGIRVYISTDNNGVLDVSEDITGFTMQRRSDGVSTFDCGLMNARRKYDGMFTPNDRIVVFLKRVTWLQTFTGYLNSVPIKTAWPTEIPLSATCSLKRLQYWYWDPSYDQTQTMIANALAAKGSGAGDGGMLNVINAILQNVVGWDTAHTHVGKVPPEWLVIAKKIAQRTVKWARDDWAASEQVLGTLNPDGSSGGVPLSQNSTVNLTVPANGDDAFVGTTSQHRYAGIPLSPVQRKHAEQVMGVGWNLLSSGYSQKDASKAVACAIAVMMVESSMKNLASHANPDSVAYPHDGVAAGDLDSVGLFQQRNAWGSVEDRMNPYRSAAMFFNGGAGGQDGLLDCAAWQKQGFGHLCQDVQVSAFPDRYAQYETFAYAMVRDMINSKNNGDGNSKSWNSRPSTGGHVSGDTARRNGKKRNGTTTHRTGRATNQDFLAQALGLVDRYGTLLQYSFGGDNIGGDPPGPVDCSSFIQAIMLRTLGHATSTPRTSASQSTWCKYLSLQDAMNTPGALMFRSTTGKPGSGVHHVEISLGNGQDTVGAHYHGANPDVGKQQIIPSHWDFGGMIPVLTYESIGQGGGADSSAGGGVYSGGTNHWPVSDHRTGEKYHKPDERYDTGYHTGVDFPYVSTGDRVEAVDDGTVVTCGSGVLGDPYGKVVVIQVGDFWTIYAQLSKISVNTADKVKMGDKIGEVGASGTVATRPVLHFEVRKYPYDTGFDVDPVIFIKNGTLSSGANGGDSSGGTGSGSTDALDTLGWGPWKDDPSFNPDDELSSMFGDTMWVPVLSAGTQSSVEAAALVGAHTLLNDTTLLPYIQNCFRAIMRVFCSAPNGDLIAWFPDWYGLWHTAAILRVEPIEVKDFTVMWSDDNFVTHQYAQAGTSVKFNVQDAQPETVMIGQAGYTSTTVGIANIDSPEIMESLFGVPPHNHVEFSRWVYDRFGARPHFYIAEGLVSPAAEFFAAIHMFMIQWAYQYRADISLTFMPEAWPGMLVQMPAFDFQAYITTVTHTGQFGDGGRFETTLNISAPAYMPGSNRPNKSHALFGLPIAGGYVPPAEIGSPPPDSVKPPIPSEFAPGLQDGT